MGPYEKGKDYSQDGQSKVIDEIFKGKVCGTFVEVGAADGKVFSNTLYHEVSRAWRGILVEPNPDIEN